MVLVGRGPEVARLEACIDAAARGEGTLLVLTGEAGIGKSALLDTAAALAVEHGATVLRAQGLQGPSSLPYDALSQLVGGLLDHLPALPDRQAAALRGALAIGPAASGDRFAVAAAAYGLLRAAAAARQAAVVVVVDDVQWIDIPSAEVLAYCSTRLACEPVAMLLARRTDPDESTSSSWLDGLPPVAVGPLGDDDAAALLHGAAATLHRSVAATLIRSSEGNPLVLLELLGTLTEAQRRGREPIDEPLRPGRRGALFDRRIEALDAEASVALLLCAAAGTTSLPPITAACRAAGIDLDALRRLDDAQLVRLGTSELRFAHPLVRSAAYHRASASDRAAAHRALASVLTTDDRAWHLAAVAVGPDEEAAAALDRLAASAARKGAPADALRALELAAVLSPTDGARIERLLQAVKVGLFANAPARQTMRYVEATEALAPPEPVRLRLQDARGMLVQRLQTGMGEEADRTEAAAERAVTVAPALAPKLFAGVAYLSLLLGDCRRCLRLAERGLQLLDESVTPDVVAPVLATAAAGYACRGEPGRANELLARLQTVLPGISPGDGSAQAVPVALSTLVILGQYDVASGLATAILDRMRGSGSLTAVPVLAMLAGDAAFRLGRWDECRTLTEEAVTLSRETESVTVHWFAAANAGRVAALRGDTGAEEQLLAVLAVAEGDGVGLTAAVARGALGTLALGRGDVEGAVAHLERVRSDMVDAGMREPTLVPWQPDLVEAYVMAGCSGDAAAELQSLAARAHPYERPAVAALVERCRGLVAPTGFETHFLAALVLHDKDPVPFERARTMLAFGARLHRARRRVEARAWLHEAYDEFEQLSATPWMDRAEAELRAAGGRRPVLAPAAGELTARERKVAEAVAQGLSNKEVAASLYLSVKTVEFHLGKAFAKLGVRSRTQLAARLREEAPG